MFQPCQKKTVRASDRLVDSIRPFLPDPFPDSFNFKDAAARTFGYKSFKAIGGRSRDDVIYDDRLTTNALKKRRAEQAKSLSAYAKEVGVVIPDPLAVINVWQPSASRPTRPVVTVDEGARLIRRGIERQTLILLAELQQAAKIYGQRVSPENIGAVIRCLDCVQKRHAVGPYLHAKSYQQICTEVALLATSLANQGLNKEDEIGQANAKLGIVLFERVCEEDDYPYAMVSLIEALRQGLGCQEDRERALNLSERVDEIAKGKFKGKDNANKWAYTDTVDRVFVNWHSRISFLREYAVLLHHADRVKEATVPLKEIVENGHKGNDKSLVVWAARHLLEIWDSGSLADEFTSEEIEHYKKLTSKLMLQELKSTYYTLISNNA